MVCNNASVPTSRFLENNPKVKADWEEPYGDRMQKLVFIGQDLDKEGITKALDKCLTEF